MKDLDSTQKSTMQQRNETITKMILDKSIFKAMDESWFQAEIEQLFEIASQSGNAEQKLLAIGALARIAFVVKSYRKTLFGRLQAVFTQPLPSLQVLDDADSRLIVARSLEFCEANDWLCGYLVTESFLEEKSGKTREALINNLILNSREFKDVLELCLPAIEGLKKNKSISHDQQLKRYMLVFKLVRKAVATATLSANDETGPALKKLFVTACKGLSDIKDFNAKIAFAEEVIYLIHSAIQIRFSLATEAKTYAILLNIQNWFGKSEWLLFLDRSDCVETIRSDLSEAVLILAKQGLSDTELLDFLILTFPTRAQAKPLLVNIADNSLAIPAQIKTWLKSAGRISKLSVDTVKEDSGILNADQSIALLLLEAMRLESILGNAEQNICSSIQMFDPQLEEQTQTLFVRNRTILNSVKSLAEKRSLKLRGRIGDVTDYSPIEHELISGNTLGIRKVRIVTPMVQRVVRDRVSTVIPAQVETVD